MKCPLSNYVMERESGEDEVLLSDCLKAECAWWSKSLGACCVPVFAANLMGLNETMLKIGAKMPHAGQFTK